MKRDSSEHGIRNRLVADSSARRSADRRLLVSVAITFGLCAIASIATAATTVWTGPSAGGVFNDDANWSADSPGDNTPPPNGLNDLGIFNDTTNVNGVVTFDADATHFRTFVQNTAGTIEFDTGPYKWSMSSFFLTGTAVGEDNHIKFINGHVVAQMYLLGNTVGQTNGDIIEVTGATTHLEATTTGGAFRVGSGGSNNTQFIVSNGAEATAPGQIIIGLVSSGNGLMKVTDAGTTVTMGGSIQVGGGLSGQADNNRLEVLAGAHVTGSQLLMGVTEFGDNNTTLVSGADSTLTVVTIGRSDIGRFGSNHILQIENGGTVDGSANYALGVEAASTGNEIRVSGSGASLTGTGVEARRGTLSVDGGDVTLNDYFDVNDMIYKGGALLANVGASSVIKLNSGSISTVHATVSNGSALNVGDGGAVPAAYHMLKTGDGLLGTHSFADGLSLSSNGVLSGSGHIVGNVSGSGGAQVDVGASAGLIDVTGNWDNTGLSIALELDDLSLSLVPGVQFDQLAVSGAFTHGGTVAVDVSQFVAPATAQQVKLIGWGSEIGPSSATTVSFLGGAPLAYSFLSDGLYVTAVPEPSSLMLCAAGFAFLAPAARRRFGAKC